MRTNEDYNLDLVDRLRMREAKIKDRPSLRADDELDRLKAMSDGVFIFQGTDVDDYFGGTFDPGHRIAPGAARIAELEVKVGRLRDLIMYLDNSVYQDGIRLPVHGWCVAPIGACRSRCNLTGSSRFELDASRSAINEAPALLKLWAEEVGQRVQLAVVNTVSEVLQKVGYAFEVETLVTRCEGKPPTLFDYANRVMVDRVLSAR